MPRPYDSIGEVVRRLLESDGPPPGWRTGERILYDYPESVPLIDRYVMEGGYRPSGVVGAGKESLVLGLEPLRASDERRVLKIQSDGPGDASADLFDYPTGVPGIAPHIRPQQITEDVAVAMQPRASNVWRKGHYAGPYLSAASRVQEALWKLGWGWSDGHKQNVGLMPDGRWAAIDGWVSPRHLLNSEAVRTEEAVEAIRQLLPTSEELRLMEVQ